MTTHEPPDRPVSDHGPSSATVSQDGGRPGRRTWVLAIVAAILAGLGSWGVVEGVLNAYHASFQPTSRPYPSPEDMVRIARARVVSGTLTFGATGALLGLALGLAGGITRGSIPRAAVAGFAGLLAGGLAEAGAAYGGLTYVYTRLDVQAEDMLQSLLTHEALWATVGLGGGLAMGLGLGGRGTWWKSAIGGLIGAGLATVVYEFLGALAFSTHGTHQPYGESLVTRGLAQILIPIGVAVGALAMAAHRGKTAKPTPQVEPLAG